MKICRSSIAFAVAAVLATSGTARAAGASVLGSAPGDPDRTTGDGPERVRVGALAGVGFPRPLAIEGMVKMGGRMVLGAEYGALPTVSFSGVNVSLWSVAGDVRFFPFRTAFFLGLRVGRQHIEADTSVSVPVLGQSSEELALDSWFINPRVGFLWTARWGGTVGIEAGVQVPLSATTSSTWPVGGASSEAQQAVATLSGVLPTVDLLRVGLLF